MDVDICLYENLRNTIYLRAAKDLIVAILTKNKDAQRFNERFLTSGAYCYPEQAGKKIVSNCKAKIEKARSIIDDFLKNSSTKTQLDENEMMIWILKKIIQIEYPDELKISYSSHKSKYYLIWVKCH